MQHDACLENTKNTILSPNRSIERTTFTSRLLCSLFVFIFDAANISISVASVEMFITKTWKIQGSHVIACVITPCHYHQYHQDMVTAWFPLTPYLVICPYWLLQVFYMTPSASWWMLVFTDRSTLVCLYVVIHRRTMLWVCPYFDIRMFLLVLLEWFVINNHTTHGL